MSLSCQVNKQRMIYKLTGVVVHELFGPLEEKNKKRRKNKKQKKEKILQMIQAIKPYYSNYTLFLTNIIMPYFTSHVITSLVHALIILPYVDNSCTASHDAQPMRSGTS